MALVAEVEKYVMLIVPFIYNGVDIQIEGPHIFYEPNTNILLGSNNYYHKIVGHSLNYFIIIMYNTDEIKNPSKIYKSIYTFNHSDFSFNNFEDLNADKIIYAINSDPETDNYYAVGIEISGQSFISKYDIETDSIILYNNILFGPNQTLNSPINTILLDKNNDIIYFTNEFYLFTASVSNLNQTGYIDCTHTIPYCEPYDLSPKYVLSIGIMDLLTFASTFKRSLFKSDCNRYLFGVSGINSTKITIFDVSDLTIGPIIVGEKLLSTNFIHSLSIKDSDNKNAFYIFIYDLRLYKKMLYVK